MPSYRRGYSTLRTLRRKRTTPYSGSYRTKRTRYSYSRPSTIYKKRSRRRTTRRSAVKKRRVSYNVKPSFKMGNQPGVASPIVKDNRIIVGYTGRQGTIYFKQYPLLNNQFVEAGGQLNLLLIRSPLIRKEFTKYHQYYGMDAAVVIYFAPLKSLPDSTARALRLSLANYVTTVTTYQGFLKQKQFDELGIQFAQLQPGQPAPMPATPTFQRVPGTPFTRE